MPKGRRHKRAGISVSFNYQPTYKLHGNICSSVNIHATVEVEQGRGILCVHPVQPMACRTWFKLYYFNPTMASINDTYIVLATIPSPAGLTQTP